jgi:putative protein kinase ArgK-like GTPase of G3E family
VRDQKEANSNQGARNVYNSHQNKRTSLVNAYMLQTGQGTIVGASGTLGASVSTGAGLSLKGASK